jgi:hypothetical protein
VFLSRVVDADTGDAAGGPAKVIRLPTKP